MSVVANTDGRLSKNRDKGVTTIEYGVMLVLIALAVALAAPNISSAVVNLFGKTSNVMARS